MQPSPRADVATVLAFVAAGMPVNGIVELAGPEPLPLDELHLHECRPIVHSNAFGLLCFDLLVTGRINDRAPARSYRRVSQRHMTCGPYLGTFGDDHLHSFLFWILVAIRSPQKHRTSSSIKII